MYSVDAIRNTKKTRNTTLCKQLALGFDHFYFYGFRLINCPRGTKILNPVSRKTSLWTLKTDINRKTSRNINFYIVFDNVTSMSLAQVRVHKIDIMDFLVKNSWPLMWINQHSRFALNSTRIHFRVGFGLWREIGLKSWIYELCSFSYSGSHCA